MKPQTDGSGFLTAREVSTRLRMPISTVYHHANSGEIPAVQIGRTWRFRRSDIDAFEQGARKAPSVLVVDDDQTVLTLLTNLLEQSGFATTTATNVSDALKLLDEDQFDALLIDLFLPDGNGADLISSLGTSYPPSRIIVITAHADTSLVNEILQRGQLTLLRKPIDTEQLLDILETRTGSRSAHPG